MKHTRIASLARLASIGGALFFLIGCPYSSEHPIGDLAGAIADDALLGAWSAYDDDSGEELTVTFTAAGDRKIAVRVEGMKDENPAGFTSYATELSGERFLNLRESTSDGDGEWYYVNYRVDGDTLMLRLVDDALFENRSIGSPEELAAFIRANLADPALYAPSSGREWDWTWSRVP